MKFNPAQRREDALERRPSVMFGEHNNEMYHTCKVLSWKYVEEVCNYAASQGYRLHTLRDGDGGADSRVGRLGDNMVRLLFERVA